MTSDFSYKKYSLENLENWMYDAMSSAEASPQEIYDVIVGVVKDNYYVKVLGILSGKNTIIQKSISNIQKKN